MQFRDEVIVILGIMQMAHVSSATRVPVVPMAPPTWTNMKLVQGSKISVDTVVVSVPADDCCNLLCSLSFGLPLLLARAASQTVLSTSVLCVVKRKSKKVEVLLRPLEPANLSLQI